ncbi:uncharacterized protein MONBRDRAFT_35901 [Monosiga brevicollis MX1]|uniref:Sulfide:quinone oxidoreductase, mitochondrial n=1 Tax=Monosiga brevicollis TaxID=81824 RepID=A9USH3_MONBE|nr:uncharacterized protein MONBRDRAFT_35901 [Monosiga brevicollis MX1]EDQ92100.1 predicted protein [Monosiga brevicollis MX1]|eukprot:XP_001743386.1 hypothetical protein [Monosiga brevicollis MX1]
MASTSIRQKHFKVAVVGGGAGGLAIASHFSEKLGKGAVGVIEPSTNHYYQPGWTLVGGDLMDFNKTVRRTSDVMPINAEWVHDAAATFAPEANSLTTAKGDTITYDYLVLAAGFQINWDAIKGLKDALGKNGVTSNYHADHCKYTAKAMNEFAGGHAVFTQPNMPIKCAGAPQKVMYIFEDTMRRNGLRDKTTVTFMQGMPSIFAIQKYAKALTEQCQERDINVNFRHVLTEVKADTKEAVFKAGEKEVTVKYDFLHVTPQMGAPDCIRNSPLAAENGMANVDKETMQHLTFPNVFAIGDCANLPTSKTAAAVAAEAPVVKANMEAVMRQANPTAKYDGYASCPLVISRDRLILAEFSAYTGQPMETLFLDQSIPRESLFFLKAEVMPDLYWDALLKGHWNGPSNVRKILNPFNA